MFFDIFRFELNFHRRQYLFYVLAGVFFLLSFLATTTPNVQIVGGMDNININSPYRIVATLTSLSLITLFGAIAFVASGVVRDYDLNMVELFFTTPVRKANYIYGRFAGAFLFAFGLYLAAMLGVLAGEFMPWLDSERIGEFRLEPYWFATWALALPSLFGCACLFFFIATVTRSIMATYVGLIGMLMLTFLLDTFTEKDTIALTSMLDPFGATALEEVTRYWTVFERNALIPTLSDALLANRLLWIGIGAAFLVAAYPLSPFSVEPALKRRRAKSLEQEEGAARFAPVVLPPVAAKFGLRSELGQYFSQTRIEIKNIVKSAPFVVLLLMGLFLVVANALANLGNIFGTAVYPTTPLMISIINGAFSLSLLAVLIYYAGELMVREKNVRISGIMDAMPFPNWIMIGAKLSGLVIVIVSMLLAAMVASIGVQLYRSFYDIDVLQYLAGLLFFFQFPLYLMMVLAVFFYVVTRNKYLSMFLMILYFIYTLVTPQVGLEHFLYRMRQLQPVYSDFTGYAQNLEPYLWQTAYWGLFGGLLVIVIHLLWPRGIEDDVRSRLRVMRQRMTQTVVIAIWAVSTLWVTTGGYIYYNTVVLNDYVTRKDTEKNAAEYEKRYKQYERVDQPVITAVYAEVDILPEEREALLRGHYKITNATDSPIEAMYLSHFSYLDFKQLEVVGATQTEFDDKRGFRIFTFSPPLAPGEESMVHFDVEWRTPGFANSGHSPKLTPNGTFFNNMDLFPLPGYVSAGELQDNNKRREHDLPPLERMPKIDDASAWHRTPFGGGHRVDFEAIVSTSEDQIAVAPGYLESEWKKDGRRYFHYKMDAPIWNFYSFISADYHVKRDSWNDVAIEVYYIHDYNVDVMIRATQNSLDYFTRAFSPYQYRQFRIYEFPRFQGAFAQAFPNTIPFSEAIGFVADLRDPENIDYVYYVTAHELAHQWWAHQVLGAGVQGSTMIVESLAQYSALMVMEKEYGANHMKRFLEFELDRYLQGRGGELIDEMPLYLVENQPYIHYRKGSVVLYAIKDYIGEDKMNRALANFIEEFAFKGPPYPTTRHLIGHIRAEAGPEYDELITDLLEKIVLFDLQVAEVSATELPEGKYSVELAVTARKFEATGGGEETEVPISGWFDIGVLGEPVGDARVPEVLHLQKYEITGNEQRFTIVVDRKPLSAGIDPLNKMIDRNPSDNIKTI